MSASVDLLKKLQDWYASQCNGEWEHSYGVSITTLDNPGWALKVELAETKLSRRAFDEIKFNVDHETDWYVCRVQDNKFEGFCGLHHLGDVIAVFLNWADSATENARSVLVVLDTMFGEKLRAIPANQPVWIVMSPTNEPVVRTLWTTRASSSHLTSITGFDFSASATAENTFLNELDTIDLHHGPHSSAMPYAEIVAIGARLTADIRAALSEYGLTDFMETEDGFAAKRSDEEAGQRR